MHTWGRDIVYRCNHVNYDVWCTAHPGRLTHRIYMRSDACIHISSTHELLTNRNTRQPFRGRFAQSESSAQSGLYTKCAAVRICISAHTGGAVHKHAHTDDRAKRKRDGCCVFAMICIIVMLSPWRRGTNIDTAVCVDVVRSRQVSVSALVTVKTCSRGQQGRTGLAGQWESLSADCPGEWP